MTLNGLKQIKKFQDNFKGEFKLLVNSNGAKVEQKRTEMAPTQICHIMQDAINAVKSLAYKKFIDIDVECPNEQAIIFANEKYLFQVLLNLLSNSIKFTEPKGRVYIGVKPKAEFVEIYVTDTGRGIPKEKIDSIFAAVS